MVLFRAAFVSSLTLALLAIAVPLSSVAFAGETWDGGGSNNEWSTDANWNEIRGIERSPSNDGTADIIMAGTTKLSNQVDVGWDINSLTFNSTAGAFSIKGFAGVTLGIGAGGMVNNDTELQTLLLPIGLNASQTWTAAAGPVILASGIDSHFFLPRTLTVAGGFDTTVAGSITNNITLNRTGEGTLFLVGADANTYAGSTSVTGGALALNCTGGADRAIPGNLIIGDGAGNDVVRLDSANQISQAAGSTVTINSSGLLNLNGFNETVANLALNGGAISGTGSLTVNESLTFPGGGSISGTSISFPALSLGVNAGTLHINGGGALSTDLFYLFSGSTISVSGANSSLAIGELRQFGTLNISDNASVSADTAFTFEGVGSGAVNVTSGGTLRTGGASVQETHMNPSVHVSVTGANSYWRNIGRLFVSGGAHVSISDGGRFDSMGFSSDTHVSSGSQVTVQGTGALWIATSGTLFVDAGGTLNVSNGGAVVGGLVHVNGGTVKGNGDISTVRNSGVLNPGDSLGAIRIGAYNQTSSGKLQFELGGPTPASEYDQLLVTGPALLQGTLEVSLVNDFIPSVGQSFTILTADDVDGIFSTEMLPSVPGLIFDVIYNPQSIVLTVGPAFTADFDEDGDVDSDDLDQWQGDFGVNNMSDADNDGDSDGADFLAWQRQLGSGPPVTAASARVPEPATAVLLTLAAVSLRALQNRAAEKSSSNSSTRDTGHQ